MLYIKCILKMRRTFYRPAVIYLAKLGRSLYSVNVGLRVYVCVLDHYQKKKKMKMKISYRLLKETSLCS